MEVEVTKKMTVHPAILQCWIGSRYWEDSSFNGEEDTEDAQLLRSLFPEYFYLKYDKEGSEPVKRCMDAYRMNFLYLEIDLTKGIVRNWPKGVTADFGYKSCDINYFRLLDEKREILAQTREGDTEYVIGPSFMNDYGDYFVLQVDENGRIQDWDEDEMKCSLQDWIKNLEDEE